MDELERIELSAVLDLMAAAPVEVADELDLAVLDLGGAAAFSVGAHPNVRLFNRVLGLDDAARLSHVEEWFASRRCTFAVSLVPGAELERVLDERGYRPDRVYMKFSRRADEPPERETSLPIEPVPATRAEEWGNVVATIFGMPPPLDRWFASLSGRAGWSCFGAFDGDRLVGTGAAYVVGDLGWIGIAGTLPEARGRGAQTASLAARIRAAAAAGARTLAVETTDRVDSEAGPSFRNVVRAGFEEAYRQRWWLRGD